MTDSGLLSSWVRPANSVPTAAIRPACRLFAERGELAPVVVEGPLGGGEPAASA
jgi:hypothetical protein